MKTGLYYLSRTDDTAIPNAFYRTFRNQIDQHFNVSSDAIIADLRHYYSTRREFHLPNIRRLEIFKRLAEIFRSLCERKGNIDSPLIGDLELEFIDLLMNNADQRIINVVGHVGIGKSTFLRYVFSVVRERSDPLQPFVPLFVNCLGIPTPSPEYHDISSQLKNDYEKSEASELLPDLAAHVHLNSEGASAIVRFLQEVENKLSKLKKRLVVIFDNVDQLTPKSVTMLTHIARGVFINSKALVVLPMRPPTYRTHFENTAEKGALRRYRFDLTPPDFREVVRIRLSRAINESPEKKVLSPNAVTIDDPADFVQRFIDALFLRDRTQDRSKDYLEGINNANIRKALLGFVFFLKWRALDWSVYAITDRSKDDAAGRERKNQRFGTLIDGLMLGPYLYYNDRRNEDCPISNIFVFDPSDSDPDFLIQYRVLSILDWSGTWVTYRQCVEWLREIQYEPQFCHACLVHLIGRGLVYNPNSENSASEGDQLLLSESGAFYLRRLLHERQYILNALYDVPLPHTDEPHGRLRLSSKLMMLRSYLDRVITQEEAQVSNLILSRRKRTALIGSFKKNGILARKIQSIGYEMVSFTKKNPDEGIQEIGKTAGIYFDDQEPRIKEIEDRIDKRAAREGRFYRDDPRQSFSFSVLGTPGCRLEVPAHFGADPARRKVRVVVNAGDNTFRGPLFATVSFATSTLPTAVINLAPHRTEDEFEGEYVYATEHRAKIDSAELMIFEGARPIYDNVFQLSVEGARDMMGK